MLDILRRIDTTTRKANAPRSAKNHRLLSPPHSDYLQPAFTSQINPGDINLVFELGAHDGQDSLLLRDFFGARVTAFECNPATVPRCRRAFRFRRNVRLVEKAVWDADTDIDFFPVIQSSWADGRATTDGVGRAMINTGASSCFRARDDYLQRYRQSHLRVPATRLDSYCLSRRIARIDLICMDVQGAALQALIGLGTLIHQVRYIIAELENREIYHGQSLYRQTRAYLAEHGFRQLAHVPRDDWFGDFLFGNDNVTR